MVPTLLKKIDEQRAEILSLREELENQRKINLAIGGQYDLLQYRLANSNYILVDDADMTPLLRSQVKWKKRGIRETD